MTMLEKPRMSLGKRFAWGLIAGGLVISGGIAGMGIGIIFFS